MLKHCRTTKVDIARANDCYFVNTIAAGIMPEAVATSPSSRKPASARWPISSRGIKALQNHQTSLFKIETDDGKMIYRSPLLVAMLTSSVGSFPQHRPPARVDDARSGWPYSRILPIWTCSSSCRNFRRRAPEQRIHDPHDDDPAKISIVDDHPLSTNMDGDEGPAFPSIWKCCRRF